MSDGDRKPETAHTAPGGHTPQEDVPAPVGPIDAAAPLVPGDAAAPLGSVDTVAPLAAGDAAAPLGSVDAAAPRGSVDTVGPLAAGDAAASMVPGDVAARAREAVGGLAGPRLVRRVVCGYRLGWLHSDWLQTWRRLVLVFAGGGLDVTATLAPLEDLPADTDILVVPPELREAARTAALPNTPILVTPASSAAGAFADLVSRLEAGTEFTAERAGPSGLTIA